MSLVSSERHGSTMLLTLNDPARRNILSTALCADLIAAVTAANADPEVKALVVAGAGKAFCAGADLADLDAAAAGRTDAVNQVYAAFMAVADSPLPTVAAVDGAAVGAGLNLALACDWRVASAAALFDTRFLRLGLHPGGGCTWMLLRAVGWAAASRMLLGGQPVRAAEAQVIGLAVPADGGAVEAALAMTAMLATVPRELALRTKATMRLAATADHHAVFAHETAEQLWSLGEPGFAASIARMKAAR